jgi:sporulation protein YlmC with PRC-barrel domain
MMMLGLEEIIGLEVISSDARVLGTVEGVMIDPTGWKVRALKVGLRRGLEEMLGHKRRYFTVDKAFIQTEEIDSVSDAIILRKPLSSVPEIFVSEENEGTPAGALLGKRVICCNARFVGNVDNLLIDPMKEWTIPYIQVKLERDALDQLNLQRSLMTSSLLSMRTADIRSIGDMVIMAVTMDDIKSQLSFSKSTTDEEKDEDRGSESIKEERKSVLIHKPFR